ncbi:molybdopterin-dependent oxidoreductase [Psychrobacter vallis]|uniref:molybdopterin-dependent oxidoreductase n=1 Tax=Psychrobacter vallis TaxID=248451 RepID=UPI00191AA3C7|nr:molybdopterin-dependent oxidoreductase [Psychrobacter vallis]
MSEAAINKTSGQSSRHPKNVASQTITTHNISVTDTINQVRSLDTAHGSIKTVRTTCPYCGVGCGVLAQIDQAGTVSVKGDPEHPANFGKLCSKGSALAQTLGAERRLIQPYYQNKLASMHQQQPMPPDIFTRLHTITTSDPQPIFDTQPLINNTDWDTVLADIAKRLNDTIAKHGRDSIMFYVSGQLLTEDYYVANKFIKGFIGSNNIDSNSRLCMSSAVAGHKRAFGADLVPANYEDLEACDLLVLVGSNMAWCHPILFGRFLAAKKLNPNKKLIVIDPRRTDSCEFADLHLPIVAGTDTHLYNGLLHYLEQHGCQDEEYVSKITGVDDALNAAKVWTIDKVASACQVPIDNVRQFYELVAANEQTVTAFSMGVNQSKSGTDKVNAIINTHLYTGRVGKVGASPFSLTGQPNAMGGREVGALANLLAAHLDLANADHRQLVADFWQSPQPISSEAGVKACDAADAILDGRIKAIWIMATNPVVSLPEADRFRQALAECDLVIVSDCSVDSDTVKCADIVLPAQGWGEKSGTVTNSERRISRQRSIMPATGVAKPDWWILSQVAKHMGLAGFDYQDPSEIFNEYVALTAYGNDKNQTVSAKNQPRYFNLAKDLSVFMTEADHNGQPIHQSLKSSALSREDYDMMPPFQWGGTRISMIQNNVSNQSSKSATHQIATCIKAQLIAITPADDASVPNQHQRKCKFQQADVNQYPLKSYSQPANQLEENISSTLNKPSIDLRLITGRLRDQWHTMTRTGLAPQLNQHQSVPTLTLHPDDAKQLDVAADDFVQVYRQYENNVTSALTDDVAASNVLVQVTISDAVRVGDAFIPMHWSEAFASFARMGTLIPTVVDPHSGQPELKNSAISVTAVPMHIFGKILVHPDWQDAVIVQLRTILDNIEAKIGQEELLQNNNSAGVDASSTNNLPSLTWNLSRQANSVLINVASPSAKARDRLNTPEFWQQFAQAVQSSVPSVSQACAMNTAFTVSQEHQQLRLVMTQSIDEVAANSSVTANIANINTANIKTGNQKANEALIMAVYLAPTLKALPSMHWLDSCFADTSQIPFNQRYKWLLAGRPASGYVDPGPLVCSCMSVGENIIIEAITKHDCTSATAVGKQCRAGTNCGSCVGQINELIAEYGQLAQA